MKKKRKIVKKKNEAFKSVTMLVCTRLKSDKDYPYEKLLKEVKALRPKSKFNESQYAWYRSAVKHNRLKGMK